LCDNAWNDESLCRGIAGLANGRLCVLLTFAVFGKGDAVGYELYKPVIPLVPGGVNLLYVGFDGVSLSRLCKVEYTLCFANGILKPFIM